MLDASQYSEEQLAAIQKPRRRIMLLSVAGSGKSRAIVGRIQWLIDQGISPSKICAITYTCAAAKALSERLQVKIGYCGTIHSMLLRLLNQNAELAGLAPGIGIIDEDRAAEMVEEIVQSQRCKASKDSIEAALRDWNKPLNPSPSQLVAAAFRQRLRQNNALTFGGILHYGRLLIQKLPAAQFPFSCILWDEVQDMSDDFKSIYDAVPVEWRFSAGDFFQGIFGFLGGNVKNMQHEMESSTVMRLSTNYRCAKSICRAASSICAAGGGTEQTLPRPDAPEGTISVRECADFQQEALVMAQTLRKVTGTVAVLFRTHSLLNEYKMAMQSYGIPIVEQADAGQPKDWRIVKAMLSLLIAPENDLLAESFISALKGPQQASKSRYEAAVNMESINAHCLNFEACSTAQEAVAAVLKTKPSPESQARLVAAVGLLEADANIGELLVALQEPPQSEVVESGKAEFLTIHASKAREFGTVILAACEEGVLPSKKDADDPAALEESRRLFYVAITRAETSLFITYCKQRQEKWWRHQLVDMKPSRFIAEAGL